MNANLRNITNHYHDVKLVSLSGWKQANEITPRDRNGPYVVMQEGYDPEDLKMVGEEFVLGRSGKWLSLGHFFRMPVPDRRAEFVFGTVTEVIQMMNSLPAKVELFRPAKDKGEEAAPAEQDDMATAFHASRAKQAEPPK